MNNQLKKYDLIVAGGGLAGAMAAIAAAREGLSVLIVEASGCFGGAMSNSLVYPFCPYWTVEENEVKKVINAGLFTELRERAHTKEHGEEAAFELKKAPISLSGGDNKLRWFSPEFVKAALDDMIVEAGVDVLFHTTVFATESEGRRIKSLRAATAAGEWELSADFFIDATGDGDVMMLSGCEYLLGREGDGLTQPMTTCFRVCNINVEEYKRDLPRIQKLYKEYRESGRITNPRENILQFYGLGDGIVHYNTTRVVKHDPTDPLSLSRAELETRRQITELFAFLKENCPAYESAVLISVASEIGVRESRKLIGEHVITEDELFQGVKYEDRIALGNYDMDIHSPDGTGTYIRKYPRDAYYYIPYRALLPKEYDNLLVAGRCISATHAAQSSIRILPVCASMGEAAGVAVSVAKKSLKNTHTLDVSALQARLRELSLEID